MTVLECVLLLLLLITGAAPVFYYDQTGRYARA